MALSICAAAAAGPAQKKGAGTCPCGRASYRLGTILFLGWVPDQGNVGMKITTQAAEMPSCALLLSSPYV